MGDVIKVESVTSNRASLDRGRVLVSTSILDITKTIKFNVDGSFFVVMIREESSLRFTFPSNPMPRQLSDDNFSKDTPMQCNVESPKEVLGAQSIEVVEEVECPRGSPARVIREQNQVDAESSKNLGLNLVSFSADGISDILVSGVPNSLSNQSLGLIGDTIKNSKLVNSIGGFFDDMVDDQELDKVCSMRDF